MSEQTPETFDIDEWLSDAKLPEHEIVIYKRPDLMAKADAIVNKYEALERLPERDGNENALMSSLLQEYTEVLEKFKASELTVRIRAMKESEIEALDEKIKAGIVPQKDKAFHEISAAVLFPRMTPEKARKLSETIGGQQAQKIWNTIFRTSGEQPEVSADFLLRASGRGNGKN